MNVNSASPTLSEEQYARISRTMRTLCGISLSLGKEGLVRARLTKRLRALRMSSFEQYLRYMDGDKSGEELSGMIDALTTNKTDFFRGPQHFDYLRTRVLPDLIAENRKIRIWSAGCSSGEEPFSIAILLKEEMPDIHRRDVRVLATDISRRMLEVARRAVYEEDALREVPPPLLKKYFSPAGAQAPHTYRVKDDVRELVRFARLNLVGEWPMKGPFNVIFCRNVMIYFDRPARQRLVKRLWSLLEPGGHLFVGHSESLTAFFHQFSYVQPAVYVKDERTP